MGGHVKNEASRGTGADCYVWEPRAGLRVEWHTRKAAAVLEALEPESAAAIVTELPPFQRRVPRRPGALGSEPTLAAYVRHAVRVLAAAREVLKKDGALWIAADDTYYPGSGGSRDPKGRGYVRTADLPGGLGERLPRKSLCLAPWRVATALCGDGWTLRAAVHRRSGNGRRRVPGTGDRPGRSLTPVFLFTRQAAYRYDENLWTADGGDDLWETAAGSAAAETAARALALSCVRQGETVLDPWAGGGETLRAAVAAGAAAIGIENDPARRDEARRRLKTADPDPLPWPNATQQLQRERRAAGAARAEPRDAELPDAGGKPEACEGSGT